MKSLLHFKLLGVKEEAVVSAVKAQGLRARLQATRLQVEDVRLQVLVVDIEALGGGVACARRGGISVLGKQRAQGLVTLIEKEK